MQRLQKRVGKWDATPVIRVPIRDESMADDLEELAQYHQQKVGGAVFFNRDIEEKIWDVMPKEDPAVLEVVVNALGYTDDGGDPIPLAHRHWISTSTGKADLYKETKKWLETFKIAGKFNSNGLLADSDRVLTIVLNGMTVQLFYARPPRGGTVTTVPKRKTKPKSRLSLAQTRRREITVERRTQRQRAKLAIKPKDSIINEARAKDAEAATMVRSIVHNLSNSVHVMDPPKSYKAYSTAENACFARALRYRTEKVSKLIKEPSWPRKYQDVLRLIGLPAAYKAPLLIPQCLQLATAMHLGVEIYVYTAKTQSLQARVHTNITPTSNFPFNGFKFVLDADNEHYYLYNVNLRPARVSKISRVRCAICDMDMPVEEMEGHMLAHEVEQRELRERLEERRQKYLSEVQWMQDVESFDQFAKRYADSYVQRIWEYFEEQQMENALPEFLWLAGYGGSGKSFALAAFEQFTIMQRLWPEGSILKLAHQGKAADAIGGKTIDRYFHPLADPEAYRHQAAEALEKVQIIFIDEIGMVTATQLNRISAKLSAMKNNDAIFGGIPVVVMGDLLQLPPVNKNGRGSKFDWFFQSPLAEFVTPVPLTAPMRFLRDVGDDPVRGELGLHYSDWLLKVREGSWPSLEEFATLPFKFLTRRELIESFELENRPIYLTHTNADKRSFEIDVMEYEMNKRGLEDLIRIPIQYFRITGLCDDEAEGSYDWDETPKQLTDIASILTDKQLKKYKLLSLHKDTLPSDILSRGLRKSVVTGARGEKAVEDDAPQVLQNLDRLFPDQPLMITQNYCGVPTDFDPEVNESCGDPDLDEEPFYIELFNGTEVVFSRCDDDYFYVMYNDSEYRIPPEVRFEYRDNDIIMVRSFPVTSMIASTVHKAQGATLDALAYNLTRRDMYKTPHLFYVAISRCKAPESVHFVLNDRGTEYWQDESIQQLRLGTCYEKLLYDCPCYVHEGCVEIMRRTMKPNFSIPAEVIEEEGFTYESSYDDVRLFHKHEGKKWRFCAPCPYPGGEQVEMASIADFHIIFDVETGAAPGFTQHPDFYNEEGEWTAYGNSSFLQQEWWMVGILPLKDGDILWCHNHEQLEPFALYQHKDGTIIFHHGEHHAVDQSLDTSDWCQLMTLRYLLALCDLKFKMLTSHLLKRSTGDDGAEQSGDFRGLTNRQKAPIILSGFNIDGFDIIGIQHQLMMTREWVDSRYEVSITPNAGSSLTLFSIWKKFGKEKLCILKMHDIQRVVGKHSSLAGTHQGYVAQYAKDPALWESLLQLSLRGARAKDYATRGLKLGKGVFPHVKTQREGVAPTLVDTPVQLKATDYFPRERPLVTRKPGTYMRMNLKRKAVSYMKGDLATTLACYLAFNKLVVATVGYSVLKVNTTQQLATNYFAGFQGGPSDMKVIHVLEEKSGSSVMYGADLPLHNKVEYDFICAAIFGGRTLPRVRAWKSEAPGDYYLQGDISGMYAHAQQAFPYPYGSAFFKKNDPIVQRLVQRQWDIAKTRKNPDLLAFPQPTSPFPHMYVAEVVIRYPSLCAEPNVPFRQDLKTDKPVVYNEDGTARLIHGIGVPDGLGGCFPRQQILSNVHLANAMADGADLLEVKSVLFWTKHGKFLEPFMREVNQGKVDAKFEKNKGKESFYKLIANSFYGACLKREQNTCQLYMTEADSRAISKLQRELKPTNAYFNFGTNGVLSVKGEKLINPDEFFSTRSTGLGVFVLAWSQYRLGHCTRTAFGNTFNPKDLQQARESILRPLLYGDTDSLYFHQTHVDRILQSDALNRNRGDKDKLIFWVDGLDKPEEKMGRFLDEQAPDDAPYAEDFGRQRYVRVVRFASCAPKSYTHKAEIPSDTSDKAEIKYKSKCKGVPLNRALLTLVDIPEVVKSKAYLTEAEKTKEVPMATTHVPPKFLMSTYQNVPFRGSISAKIEPEEKDDLSAQNWLDIECFKQKEEMRKSHEIMFEAISSDKVMIATHTPQTLKKYGMIKRTANVLRSDGTTEVSKQYVMGATNLDRCICKDADTLRWKGRRNLTVEEIDFLFADLPQEKREWIRRNHLVAIGYNYDGALFKLR